MASCERQRRARSHRGLHDVAAPRRPLDLALPPGSSGQASAAAAFFARAAQRLDLSCGREAVPPPATAAETRYDGFCGALHRLQPPLPPPLQRRLGAAAKDFTGAGKVRVMLRLCGDSPTTALALDHRKKQVTLADPSPPPGRSIAAPRMFAFDAVFTDHDSQADVCSNSLTDAIHAVINGTDGCLFCFGAPAADTARTTVGSPGSADGLGAMPCAISWLFRAVAERKQRTAARFSVRVSAIEVVAASNLACDLLKGYASEGEQPPGVYLREDPLFGTPLQHHSELRAPSPERAAFYLDAALASLTSSSSPFVFTLHVYQYSVAGLRGVAGGRSRLHVVDLGDCHRTRSNKELTLNSLGGVLLAIFSGHKHLPYREHKLTQLLKDCFSSLMCHTTVLAHVSPLPCHYADTLATLQLAARMHRIRHRKIKFFGPSVGCSFKRTDNAQPAEGSDAEPSSSEQSADTVIYVGATDEATDGEHPPTYVAELAKTSTSARRQEDPASEVAVDRGSRDLIHRTPAIRRYRSPAARSGCDGPACPRDGGQQVDNVATSASDEQWVDGPRVPRSRLLFKDGEVKETWVDGPLHGGHRGGYGFMDEHKKLMLRSWVENHTSHVQGKGESRGDSTDLVPATMAFIANTQATAASSAQARGGSATAEETLPGNLENFAENTDTQQASREISIDVSTDHFDVRLRIPVTEESPQQSASKLYAETTVADKYDHYCAENCDEEHEIIEVEEPVEAVSTQDFCLQVTEEEIALCMEQKETTSLGSQQTSGDHPLHILSEENLTTISTFTESTLASVSGVQQPLRTSFEYVTLDQPINLLLASSVKDFDQKPNFQDSSDLNSYTPQMQSFLTQPSATEPQRRKQHTGARIFHYHFPTRRSYNFGIYPEDLIKDDTCYVPVGVQSAYSEPTPQQAGSYTGSNLCNNCKRNFNLFGCSMEVEHEKYSKNDTVVPRCLPWLTQVDKCCVGIRNGSLSMLSLRHPDGASNPNLSEGGSQQENDDKGMLVGRRPGAVGGAGVSSCDSGHESGSPQLKKQAPQPAGVMARSARCESSGYESFRRDSECSSISSSQDSEVNLHDPGGATPVFSCWQWMLCGSGGWMAAGGRDKDDPGA